MRARTIARTALATLVSVGTLLCATPAKASGLVDESERAFTFSLAPHVSVGKVLAARGAPSVAAVMLGLRLGGQPTWYSGLYLDAGVTAGFSGPEAPPLETGRSPLPRDVVAPYLAPMVSLRPWSGIEATAGPLIGAFRGPLFGVLTRLSFLFPMRRFRFGPGIEVSHFTGDDLRMTVLSGVFTFDLPVLSRSTR